jgi:hypothetical protein
MAFEIEGESMHASIGGQTQRTGRPVSVGRLANPLSRSADVPTANIFAPGNRLETTLLVL